MSFDVAIIGGSYAGMAAGLQLVRARRSVLVIDEGKRRNRFSGASHGFLTQDGVDPAAIAQAARTQLEAYPSLTWVDTAAIGIEGERDRFVVTTNEAERFEARRILLAIGVADHLPQVAGLTERWGKSVFHCPYCHGYELNRGQIGVIATGPMSTHQAELLTEWGKVTLLTNTMLSLDNLTRERLWERSVTVEDVPIARIEGNADTHLTDGRTLSFAGLFVATRCEPADPIAIDSGCAVEEAPMGTQLRITDENETSIPGIFACGDIVRPPQSISRAVGDGALAGMQVHRSLIWP